MEDLLYKKFIKVNPELSKSILTFILDNCQIAIKNLSDEDSKMTLEYLKNNMSYECDFCNLCDRGSFKEKRLKLKKISSLSNSKKIIKLNKLAKKMEGLSLAIEENNNHWQLVSKTENLFDSILLNFINYSISKINAEKSEYFEQIARILLSTNKFIADINDLRKRYFDAYNDVFPDYDYIPKVNVKNKIIKDAIEDIMQKYNMAKWWKGWIKSLLRYDINKNLKKIMNAVPNISEGSGKRKKPIYGPDFEKYLRCYQLREKDKDLIDIFFSENDNYKKDWSEFKKYDNSTDIAYQTKLEKEVKIKISRGINCLKSRVNNQK